MTTTTFSKASLRVFRAFAFLFVPAMLLTACGGGPQSALPFAPSALPSSSMALEAADESDAAAPAAFGTLGNGGDHGKGGGSDKDKNKDGTTTPELDGEQEEEEEEEDEEEEQEDGEDGGPNPHEGPGPFHGTVSSLRGPCPTVTFNLKGMKIVTTEGTTYEAAEGVLEANCEMLRPNVKVIVTGVAGTGRRVFTAETITIVRKPNDGSWPPGTGDEDAPETDADMPAPTE